MELVERDAELDVLRARLGEVTAAGGHAVLVGGEAGIGKTTLLQALAQRRGDAVLWWGACDALQTPHPLAPLHDIARSAEVSFRALLQAEGSRVALFEAVLTELQHSRRPTLLVIEDAHWADDATLDLLKFIGRRIDRAACLLVVSFRDDETSRAHPLRRLLGELPAGRVTRIDVARLSPEGVALLAGRALRSPAGLHAATQGNPFFVTELLRHSSAEVPRAVQDLVLARYARLDADAQAIVSLASVVPTRIERWLVEQTFGSAVAPIEACLQSGLLATCGPSAFCFRHELARVAIESSLPEPVARSLHAAVLQALEQAPAREASLARLVHHATRAGDHRAVLRHAPEAARQAQQRGALREAAAHYGVALRHAEAAGEADDAGRMSCWLDAYAIGCERTHQLDEYIGARLRLDGLLRRAGDIEGVAHNLCQLALACALALRGAEADAASREAIELLETRAPGVALAKAYRVAAHLRLLDRDGDASIRWSAQAIELAERLGDGEAWSAASSTLGAAVMFAEYEAGRAHLQRALERALAEGHDLVAVNAFTNLAAGSCEMLRLDAAEHHLAQGLAFAERHECEMYRSYYLSWLSLCEMYRGRWDEAVARAQSILEEPTWQTNRITALVALSRVQARRGNPAAQDTLDQALQAALVSGSLRHLAPVRAARAEAADLRGDPAAVAEEAGAALALAQERRHPWFAGELAWWMHRAGRSVDVPVPCAEPFALQIAGRWAEAAAAWNALGCPYEHARALAEADQASRLEALKRFEAMQALPARDALRRALRAAGASLPRGVRASTQSNPHGLTRREVEVLHLLCLGLTNAAIAGRLVRSVRTVDHHLAAVYAKLGVSSRTAALAAALKAGIVARDWATSAANLGKLAVGSRGLPV
jgi:DNA-binding CsgD family transcriptional regulator